MHASEHIRAHRAPTNPIIAPQMDTRMGANINGPSLIRAPRWLPNPLGRYYLYFAHHQGEYIRLACAEDVAGPWIIYEPGTLRLEQTPFVGHIASPDVHIDRSGRIRMYYHGPTDDGQKTGVAISSDGINFQPLPGTIGPYYMRVFKWGDYHYAIGRHGAIHRAADPLKPFEPGPVLLPDIRHNAVQLIGSTLRVFYSNIGDCPERILMATIDLTPHWRRWRPSAPTLIIEPETQYEGADLPLKPSASGSVHQPVRQLRDPCIFEDNGETYLLYSVAGESGIAIATLEG